MPKKKATKKATKKAVKKSKPAIPKADTCVICRYSKPIDDARVSCRRYPAPPGTTHQSTMLITGWCGEFAQAK